MENKTKRHRNIAHMWADKQVIRFFRKNFEKKHYKNFRSVYLALCEIDSDFGEGKEITGFTKTVATYAGRGTKTTSLYLRALKEAEIINYQQKECGDGRFGKTQLIIYKWEKGTKELVFILTGLITEIPLSQNSADGKQRRRQKDPHKNTKVSIIKNSKESISNRECESEKNFSYKKPFHIEKKEKTFPKFSEPLRLTYKIIKFLSPYRKVVYSVDEVAEFSRNIEFLLSDKKISVGRIDTVLDWYSGHVKERYTPAIHRGQDFYNKFTNLEAAMVRYNKKPKKSSSKSTEPIIPKG